jgi:hypothetical protein
MYLSLHAKYIHTAGTWSLGWVSNIVINTDINLGSDLNILINKSIMVLLYKAV